jgi:hypothetical protein
MVNGERLTLLDVLEVVKRQKANFSLAKFETRSIVKRET